MGTTDFTFSIPVNLPTLPLEATPWDESHARAREQRSQAEDNASGDVVSVSSTARTLAQQRPTFGDEAAADAPADDRGAPAEQPDYAALGRMQRAAGGAVPTSEALASAPANANTASEDAVVAQAAALL